MPCTKVVQRRRILPSLLLASSALAALGAMAQNVDDGVTHCGVDVASVLQRVSAVRGQGASCGQRGRMEPSGPLQWNEQLRDMALMQAQFLSDIEDLRHAGPNGQTITDRAKTAGYRFSRVAENLALGAQSVDHVLRAWTASESHCVNLYDQRFTEVALVCARGKGGRPLWVMVMGRPKAATS